MTLSYHSGTTVTTTIQKLGKNKLNEDDLSNVPNNFKLSWFEVYFGFKTPLIWHNIIMIIGIHVLATHSLLTYHWIYPNCVKLTLYGFAIGTLSGFGVTAGAHRLWCHRSYKAKLPLRIFLMLCFSLSGQNSLREWVMDHRVHHRHTETDADPHDSRRGFFFSHVGWLMMRKHPEVIRRGKEIDYSDLYMDSVFLFHQKYFWVLKILLCFVLPSLIPALCWGEDWYWSIMGADVIRYVIMLNATWSVNSAAHIWGYKPYDKRIKPTENLLVSFAAIGEGWHNYHHVFPWDYRASEMGYYLNVTTFWLDVFKKMGLAYGMKTTSEEAVKRAAGKYGDGSRFGEDLLENFN